MKTVSNLQERLCPDGNIDDSEYIFTYIDTDLETYNKLIKDGAQIRQRDFIDVGPTNPWRSYDEAKNGEQSHTARAKRFMEWCWPQDGSCQFTLLDNPLHDGAKGQRMVGRTALYQFYNQIVAEIQTKLGEFTDIKHPNPTPNIWVVASSCGGTGSSMTLDILHMLDYIVKGTFQTTPEVKLVLFMPKPFIDGNETNQYYPLNAYSYFWEMNALRLDFERGIPSRFGLFSVEPRIDKGKFPLFKYVIPVDIETDKNTKISLDSLYPTVAELIYYCNNGQGAREMISTMCNDETLLTRPANDNDHTIWRWTKSYVPYGYRLIKKPNDEFREYVRTRARYEVLKYGVLGTPVPEELRRDAKNAFAKEYILKYLCDIPAIGYETSEGESLQSQIAEAFSTNISATNLTDKTKVASHINAIKESFSAADGKLIRSNLLGILKESINKGVRQVILEHGLEYAKHLLELVDDFYLEEPILVNLKVELEAAKEQMDTYLSTCNSYASSFNARRQAAAAAQALNSYRDSVMRYHTLELVVKIIEEDLCPVNGGYLEVLRKGNRYQCNGLAKVIEKVTAEVNRAYKKYRDLADAFLKKDKDALTVFLPSLKTIAAGENDNYWPNDNLFDRLYNQSIIGYDLGYEREKGERIPVRKHESGHDLQSFVGCVCEDNSKSLLALALDNEVQYFERNFAAWILGALDNRFNTLLDNDVDTPAKTWLDTPLLEALEMDGMLPEGETVDSFFNEMSNHNNVPVLYPIRAGIPQVQQVRLMYVGASQTLAEKLGYKERNSSMKYIEDADMADRFLIIKMPIGQDFYSYKYFDEIKGEYDNNSEAILAGAYGCHIHRSFSLLDIDDAVERIQMKVILPAVKSLFSALYVQTFLDKLKENNRELYDQMWGEFNFNQDEVDSFESVEPIDFGFDDGGENNNQVGDQFNVALDQDNRIIKVDYDDDARKFTINLNRCNSSNGYLTIVKQSGKSQKPIVVNVARTLLEFFRAYLESAQGQLEYVTSSVEAVKTLLKHREDYQKAFAKLRVPVRNNFSSTALMRLVSAWLKNSHGSLSSIERDCFKVIQSVMNGIL